MTPGGREQLTDDEYRLLRRYRILRVCCGKLRKVAPEDTAERIRLLDKTEMLTALISEQVGTPVADGLVELQRKVLVKLDNMTKNTKKGQR